MASQRYHHPPSEEDDAELCGIARARVAVDHLDLKQLCIREQQEPPFSSDEEERCNPNGGGCETWDEDANLTGKQLLARADAAREEAEVNGDLIHEAIVYYFRAVDKGEYCAWYTLGNIYADNPIVRDVMLANRYFRCYEKAAAKRRQCNTAVAANIKRHCPKQTAEQRKKE
jgi:hypothetical protein